MLNELQRWFPNIEYEFVEDLDQEDLTDDIIQENFDLLSFKNRFGRDMLRSEMSLCMKYKKAINVKTSNVIGLISGLSSSTDFTF